MPVISVNTNYVNVTDDTIYVIYFKMLCTTVLLVYGWYYICTYRVISNVEFACSHVGGVTVLATNKISGN